VLVLGFDAPVQTEHYFVSAYMLIQCIAREIMHYYHVQSLRDRLSFGDKILQSMSSGFLILDPDLTVTNANQSGCELLEVPKERLIGSKLSEHVLSKLLVRDIFITGQPIIDQEVVIRLAHKNLRILKTAVPVFGKDGSVIAVLDHFREIKEAHKLATRITGAKAGFTFEDIIHQSRAMREVIEIGKLAADNPLSVLITGESGTGKELLAHAIHMAGIRRSNPFVIIDCASLPRDLVAGELFGYVEGAFTGARKGGMPGKFELAEGGTVFLDEIGELPLELQAQFLRVLQSRKVSRLGSKDPIPVDIRIIAATNKDLSQSVRNGAFREDLFYRIHVLTIQIPALRSRPDDIEPLAEYFCGKYCRSFKKTEVSFSAEAMEILKQRDWPGNVRELENVVARAVHICGERIEASHVTPPVAMQSQAFSILSMSDLPMPGSGAGLLREMEQELISQTIAACSGNISQASRQLGLSRSSIYKRLSAGKL
jgi:transcriptional regulator with PAS, ATPase and Fis domain